MFLIFPFELWWSSNINNVVICSSIPQETANKLKENPLKKSILTTNSPKTPPKGLDTANSKRKITFFK
jgi:hypothetical protein